MSNTADNQEEKRGLRRSRRTRKGVAPKVVVSSESSSETESEFVEARFGITDSDIAQFESDTSEECVLDRVREQE